MSYWGRRKLRVVWRLAKYVFLRFLIGDLVGLCAHEWLRPVAPLAHAKYLKCMERNRLHFTLWFIKKSPLKGVANILRMNVYATIV